MSTPLTLFKSALYDGLKARYAQKEKIREGITIHASSLIDFCPREYAICTHEKLMFNAHKPAGIPQMLTYEIGCKIEEIVLGALDYAHVLCYRDDIWIPRDMFGYSIVGTPDAFVRLLATFDRQIVEVKSIKPDDFDVLSEPRVTHECQLSLYLWMAELVQLENVNYNDGFIVYVCKTQKQTPFKIYHVRRNNDFLRMVQQHLNSLKTFSENGELPQRICNSPQALMARRPCKCVKQCFKLERIIV